MKLLRCGEMPSYPAVVIPGGREVKRESGIHNHRVPDYGFRLSAGNDSRT